MIFLYTKLRRLCYFTQKNIDDIYSFFIYHIVFHLFSFSNMFKNQCLAATLSYEDDLD